MEQWGRGEEDWEGGRQEKVDENCCSPAFPQQTQVFPFLESSVSQCSP